MSSDETYGSPSGANNSTIEYAENAKIAGVSGKKVFNVDSSGNLVNPATSDNQTNGTQKTQIVDSTGVSDPFSGYGLYAVDSDDATYFYVMYQNLTPAWIIIRITLATGITNYSKGTGTTSTAWTSRAGQTYADYDTTFS